MLISSSITLQQSPNLHREQRLQPTKKLLRDTEGNKRFQTPAFSKSSQVSEQQKKARFCFETSSSYSKKSSLCSRILFLFYAIAKRS